MFPSTNVVQSMMQLETAFGKFFENILTKRRQGLNAVDETFLELLQGQTITTGIFRQRFLIDVLI